GPRENGQAPKACGVDALELMLEYRRTLVRADRRDERCTRFQLVQARPSEIDDEAILASHGAGVDNVAADEGVDNLTELRVRDRRAAEAQPILQVELCPAVDSARQ